jgi:hypothetical protein
MTDLTTIISALNLLGLGGLSLFIYYVIKGLRERVANLTELAREQKDTLEAVRTRAVEMDKLSKDYKQALTDFQKMGKRLDERRNELVKELELANQRKDVELARLAHLELEEIELKKQSLNRLPDIERKLDDTVAELSRQLKIVSPNLLVKLSARRSSLKLNWPAHNLNDLDVLSGYLPNALYWLLISSSHDIDHLLPLKKVVAEAESRQADAETSSTKNSADEATNAP